MNTIKYDYPFYFDNWGWDTDGSNYTEQMYVYYQGFDFYWGYQEASTRSNLSSTKIRSL